MPFRKIMLSNSTLPHLIFHLVFWSAWIGLPIVNAGDHPKMLAFSIAMIPVSLTNIPLFLINSEYLIPKIFSRKGLSSYLFALAGLIFFFAFLQMALKEVLVPEELMRHHWDLFWGFVPVLFMTAISTGYGFIKVLVRQESARKEEQEERLRSELAFLRSQISPHFIFNVLNSIVYLIRSKSPNAEAVTIKLSELMRYMLYESGTHQVPLDKEIGYLKNYVELQQIRFEEDVDIRLKFEGQAGGQLIEPMLMIPFVENAFKHGVGLIANPVIDISVKVHENHLDFTVRNRITPESATEKDAGSGIGLKNVSRRLELLYPTTHQLKVNRDDEWFEVVLSVDLGSARKNIAHLPVSAMTENRIL